jgi:MYXO-CTERM domain-containing protein
MFQSSSGGDWDCQPTQGALTCSLKQLGVTTAPPLTLSLLVSTAGSFTLAATVSSPVADPVPGNNSATVTLTGGGAATGCACSVGGGGSPGSAAPGLGLLLVALLAARRRRAGRLVPAT